MVAAKATAVIGPTPPNRLQQAARRRRLGGGDNLLVKALDPALQGLGTGQERLYHGFQIGALFQGVAHPPRQLARAPGKAKPQGAEETPDRVLRVAPLAHQVAPRLDEYAL